MYKGFVISAAVVLSVIAVLLISSSSSISADVQYLIGLYFSAFLVTSSIIGVFLYYFTSPSSENHYSLLENCDDNIVAPADIQMTHLSKSLRMEDISWCNSLNFMLNGAPISLVNPDPTETLASFIRDKAGLKGTKLGCEEGGCGACTVVLTTVKSGIISVNSCLRPLCAMDGQALGTVESIGSVAEGLSEEQQQIVKNNGTQCGFCTPGWVSNMHALNCASEDNQTLPTGRQLENYLDGNICRCTGYRPIVKAFKSFTSSDNSSGSCGGSANHECAGVCASQANCQGGCSADLEALCISQHDGAKPSHCPDKKKSVPLGRKRDEKYVRQYNPQPLMFYNAAANKRWVRPVGLEQLCAVLRHFGPTNAIQLMAGNTSIGISKYCNDSAPYYSPDSYSVVVDINAVPILTTQTYDPLTQELTVGAATTLNTLISLLQSHAKSRKPSDVPVTTALHSEEIDHGSLFSVLAHHLTLIAGSQVRNAGSFAGNLMLFMKHQTFPSDAVLAFATVGAKLHLCDADSNRFSLTMEEFLSMNYSEFQSRGLIILSATFTEPRMIGTHSRTGQPVRVVAETFRIAQRARNSHAHVNAGFTLHVSGGAGPVLCTSARVVFGGVSKKTFIAKRVEGILTNALLTYDTLVAALSALDCDLSEVGISQAFGDQHYRESVMQTYLYRAFLRCYPACELPANVASTTYPWLKPESRGTELFLPSGSGPNPIQEGPVGKPVRKLEAPLQATGEAVYPSDEVLPQQGLHGAMLFSSQCAVNLLSFDVSAASQIPGFVRLFTAADVPGSNSVADGIPLFVSVGEQVQCVGAPLGVVIATSEAVANAAAAAIIVNYSAPIAIPITNVDDAVAQQSFFPINIPGITVVRQGNAEQAMQSAARRVSGHISATGQSHMYMETQTALSTPADGDCVDVVCGTQDPAGNLSVIAGVLAKPQNKVTVRCPRAGGAFGGKITRGVTVAASSALAATLMRRPVRIFNTRTADMNMTGGRESFAVDYEIGFTEDGVITAVKYNFYIDGGMASGDAFGGLYMGMHWADNAYFFPNYLANAKLCYTNTPARTSMRAPGVVQASLATEVLIERVAVELGLPTHVVQQRNFVHDGTTTITGQPIVNCTLDRVWSTSLQRSRYEERLARVQEFNANNLWRKRGLSICPVKYGIGWNGYNAGVRIGIRSVDGTVIVSHSGTEIGQGINTKMAQAVAYELGIDLSLVRVTATSTEKIANGGVTGGSGTSEVITQAALNACDVINARLDPYREGGSLAPAANRRSRGRGRASAAPELPTADWVSLLTSLPCDVSLNAEGWYSPTANPNQQEFQYFVYAAAVSEVEMDVLSGDVMVLAGEIVYDCGQSLNPAVDIGQIEGAFVMGLGYFLTENVIFDSAGNNLTMGTFEYKVPLVKEIPAVFNVTLLDNIYNKDGILGSKAVGEPPYIIANSIYFAVKAAIFSARADAGNKQYFALPVPAVVETRQQNCLVTPSRFVLPF